ncbi:hypothetical protein PpBr36_07030 [Pyricularia pennisetigena]|uniref:hypothetical protein n=1 Tax=Pyricularia pennisetigena TaxID=1578925 RepID=UPI00115411C4|nr:hypothetical protein PpBr36_07030 [Pyricularia pennisetigena]TLS25132.1 hypothetical protein PpBr36_07030 [Pyricularia pennisetigena]
MSSLQPIPSNYSDTEYSFREDEADAIIKTVGWGSCWYDDVVVRFPSEGACGRCVISVAAIQQKIDRTAGIPLTVCLWSLPLELLQDVIWRLDILSLFRFRQSNAKVREMVGTLKEYGIIMDHAINVVCAHFRTYKTAEIPLHDLSQLVYGKSGCIVFEIRKDIIISIHQACKVAGLEREFITASDDHHHQSISWPAAVPHTTIARPAKSPTVFDVQGVTSGTWIKKSFRAESMLHDRNSFLEHFKRCQEGQRLWESSDGGALLPAHLSPTLRKYRLTE